jgi:hypothetical protein
VTVIDVLADSLGRASGMDLNSATSLWGGVSGFSTCAILRLASVMIKSERCGEDLESRSLRGDERRGSLTGPARTEGRSSPFPSRRTALEGCWVSSWE